MIVSHRPVMSRSGVTRASRLVKALTAEQTLASEVADALNRTLADIPMERIRAVLAASTAQEAADAVSRLASLSPGLAELREAAERALGPATATAAVQEAGRLGFSYQVSPERAILWAKSAAADMVTAISPPTRAAIRATIVDALESGAGIPETAKAIRQVVGLHPRWAAAVRRLHAESLAGGASPAVADAVALRYRARLVRRRAEMIARTELVRASAEGHSAAWQTAKDLGVWGDEEPVREWLAALDARTCPMCRALHGTTVVGLDTPFADGTVLPPRHPQCRCRCIVTNALVPESARPKPKVSAAEKRHIRSLRQATAERANAVIVDAHGTLDQLDVLRIRTPPPRKRTTDALGRVRYVRGTGGEWDWFDALSDPERARVSRNWFSSDYGTQGPDEIAQHFLNAGAASDWQEALQKWLDLTRRHDAGLAVRRGRLPSEKVFGNFDLDGTFGDGTYRVRDVLNPDLEEAARALATTDAEQAGEFAERMLRTHGRSTGLPPPWELSMDDYVGELTELEDLARFATPTGGDAEFGWTYAAHDERTFRRIRELAPPELDEASAERLSASDLWAVIQEQAKLAGLVA